MLAIFNEKCDGAWCLCYSRVAVLLGLCCSNMWFLCNNKHLLHSCFFQFCLLPCLQLIQKLMEMVRKEQHFMLMCLLKLYFSKSSV